MKSSTIALKKLVNILVSDLNKFQRSILNTKHAYRFDYKSDVYNEVTAVMYPALRNSVIIALQEDGSYIVIDKMYFSFIIKSETISFDIGKINNEDGYFQQSTVIDYDGITLDDILKLKKIHDYFVEITKSLDLPVGL